MGRKGGSRHLKRKPAPKFWPIHRKELVWTIKPKPGSHRISNCIPLLLIIRDILGFAKSRKGAKTVISQGEVKVDGEIEREGGFPVGLMDVISIPALERAYRVLPSGKGLTLHPIDSEEAKFKLCRIENKRVVKGGNIQLNLHDGRCILVQVDDPKNPEKTLYRTLDVLKIGISEQEVIEHSNLAKGVPAIIFGGKNMGKHGSVVAFEKRSGQKRRNLLATIEDAEGTRFQTIVDLVFPLGHKKPWISLPEVH
ncbi:MAG: 30S ribosomal protein S4e [Candidatus Bathyarchaeota archaeon]|nr:MAG: 30S ribosomal protein S4e [Candidatus Bathyarchaeota archaeon]